MFLIRSCQGDLLCDARPNSVEGKHAAVSMHGAAKDRRSLWAERRQLANWINQPEVGSQQVNHPFRGRSRNASSEATPALALIPKFALSSTEVEKPLC